MKSTSGQSVAGLMALLVLVACGGASGDGGAPTPSPSSTAPSPGPSPSGSVTTAFPAPAPSPYPACTPSSSGPCALLDITKETDGFLPPSFVGRVLVDDTSVYWATSASSGSLAEVVRSVPKSGAQLGVDASTVLATVGHLGQLVVGATSLFWSDEGTLNSLPKAGGGSPTQLTTDTTIGALAVDATDVYFGGSTAVSRVPVGGGPVTALAPGLVCTALVLSDTDVYCRTPNDVVRFPKSGGPTTSVLQASGRDLVLLDSKMYVDNRVAGVEVVTLPLAGGMPLVVPVGATDVDQLRAFGGALYFLSSLATIHRAPLDGSSPTSVPLGGFRADDLAVDASGVYWADRRWSCVLSIFTPSTGRSDPGSKTCLRSVGEIRVIRMPLVF